MQKQHKPTLSNTSLSALQTLYILIRVNPHGFNPFWLPALHTSAVLPWGAVTREFRIWVAGQKHIPLFRQHAPLFISAYWYHLCPLTASEKVPVILPWCLFFSNTSRWSCATLYPSVFYFYMSLIVGTTSPAFLGNFQHLTFSVCHLVLSLQSHKRKWLLGGQSYIYHPEPIMVRWM